MRRRRRQNNATIYVANPNVAYAQGQAGGPSYGPGPGQGFGRGYGPSYPPQTYGGYEGQPVSSHHIPRLTTLEY